MDFLKAAQKQAQKAAHKAAQAAQEQVNEIAQGALDLTGYADVLGPKTCKKEVEFGDGPLGFRIDGIVVVSVEANLQAEELGVEVGDRLLAVAGYAVPTFQPGDFEGEQRAMQEVNKWLRNLPRPSSLTFVPCAAAETGSPVSGAGPCFEQAAVGPLTTFSPLPSPSPLASGCSSPATDLSEQRTPDGDGLATSEENSYVSFPAEANKRSNRAAFLDYPSDSALTGQLISADASALQEELRREQNERQQLEIDIGRIKLARSRADASLKAVQEKYQARIFELEKEAASAREKAKLAMLAASTGEADSSSALEVADAKVEVLQEEVNRLHRSVEDSVLSAAGERTKFQGEANELKIKLATAEKRADAAELRADALSKELRGVCEAHEAELELARNVPLALERKQELVRAELEKAFEKNDAELNARLADLSQKLEESEKKTAEAEVVAAEATAKVLEAAVHPQNIGRFFGSDGVSHSETLHPDGCQADAVELESGEASFLKDRIVMLESRCATLQQKLNSRPVFFQNNDDVNPNGKATWELKVVSLLGTRVGAIVVLFRNVVETQLRNFTRRLLKRDAWLWIFYAHLLYLYMIAASSYTQVVPLTDGSTADIQLKQASDAPPIDANR